MGRAMLLIALLILAEQFIPVPHEGMHVHGPDTYTATRLATDAIHENITVYTVTQRQLIGISGVYWRDTLVRGAYGCDIDEDGVEELIVWGLRFIYIVDRGRVVARLTTSMIGHPSWYFDKPVVILPGSDPVLAVSASNVYDVQPRFYNPATPGTGIRTTYSVIVLWRPLSGSLRMSPVFTNRVYLSRTAVYNTYSGTLYVAGADIYIYGTSGGVHRITIYLAELDTEARVNWESRVYSESRRVPRLYTFTSIATSYYLYIHPLRMDPREASLALFASGYTGYWRIEIMVRHGVEAARYVELVKDSAVNMIIPGSTRSIHIIGLSNIHDTPPLWKSYSRADTEITDGEALIPMAYGYYTGFIVPSPLWDRMLLRTERFIGYIYAKRPFSGRPVAEARIIAGRDIEAGYVAQTIVSSAIYRGVGGTRIYMVLYCYRQRSYRLYLVKYNPYIDTIEKHVWLRESVVHQVYLDIVGDKLALFTPGRIVIYDASSLAPLATLTIGSPPPGAMPYSYIQVPAGRYRVGGRYIYVAQLYDRSRDYPSTRFMQMIPYTVGSALAAIEVAPLSLTIEAEPRIMLYGETVIRYAADASTPIDAEAMFTVKGLQYNYTVATGWIDLADNPRGEAYLSIPARGEAVLVADTRISVAQYNYMETGFIYNPPDIYGGTQEPVLANAIVSASTRIYVPGVPVELEIRRPPRKLPPAAYMDALPIEIVYRERYGEPGLLPPVTGILLFIYGDEGVLDKAFVRKRISEGEGTYVFIDEIDARFMEPRHTYVFEAVYPGDELREPAYVNHTVYAAGILTRLALTAPGAAAARDTVTVTIHLYSSIDNASWIETRAVEATLRIIIRGPYLDEAVEENVSKLPWSHVIQCIPRGTYRVEAWMRIHSPVYEQPAPASAALHVAPLRPVIEAPRTIRVGEPLPVTVEEEVVGMGVVRGVSTGYVLEVEGPGGTVWSAEASSPGITVPGRVFAEPGNYTVRVTLIDTGGWVEPRTGGLALYYEETTVEAPVEVSPAARLVLTVKPQIDLGNGSTYTLTPVLITVETDPPVPGAYITVTVEDTNYTLRGGGAIEHVFRTPGAKRVVAVYRLGGYAAETEKTVMVYPRPVAIDAGKPPYINNTLVRVVDYEGKDAAGILIIRYSAHGVDASTAINYTGGEVKVDPRAIGIAAAPAEAHLVHVEIVFIGNASYGNATRVFDILLLPGENSGPRPLPEPGLTPIFILAAVLAAALLRRTASPGNKLSLHRDV